MKHIPWPKIATFTGKTRMRITQKLDGTNGQICITTDPISGVRSIHVGSRNRWLTSESDNYGFHQFIQERHEIILNHFHDGTYYGEFCGPGIQKGEGLKEKGFYLFNFKSDNLPRGFYHIPLIYDGEVSTDAINQIMFDLKKQGSYLVEGYKNPEGIVIEINGARSKLLFEDESKPIKPTPTIPIDIQPYLQPLRLTKVLGKDEQLILNYPRSLPQIVQLYIDDMIAEGNTQLSESFFRSKLSRAIFGWIKTNQRLLRNDK